MLRDQQLFTDVNGKWLETRIKELFYDKEGTDLTITSVNLYEVGGDFTAELSFKGAYATAALNSYVDKNGKFDIILGDIEFDV